MPKHLWVSTNALFLSGYYNGSASLIETAKTYPEFTTQSKLQPEYDEVIQWVPVISLTRKIPYKGTTEWDQAANILLGRIT